MNSEINKEYSVNWQNHMNHVRKAFDHLLTSNELTDVTLCCEGKKLQAHKMLLSACSTYFRDTFKEVPCQHPVIILYGVEYSVLSDILRFIYNGEVSVDTSKLDSFLKLGQLLQISGLTDNPSEKITSRSNENSEATTSSQISQETYIEEPMSDLTPNTNDGKRGMKRSVPVTVVKQQEIPNIKIQRQDDNTLFISDVKCEPSELVSFEDPLEDPLQSDQIQDPQEFLGDGTGHNPGEREYKIELENIPQASELPVRKLVPKNTVKTKAYIWSIFKKFCLQRKYTINQSTSVEEISEILCDWASNMKKSSGADYKEGVVKTIWNMTSKMIQELFETKYNIKFNPFKDDLFKRARDSRDMKRRQIKFFSQKSKLSSWTSSETDQYPLFLSFNENTPLGLQRKLYHIVSFHLGWSVVKAANCLIQHFRKEFSPSGTFTGRIEYSLMLGKTQKDGRGIHESKWLVVNTVDPNVCPVRLLLKFMEKRATNTSDRLFLIPNVDWNKTNISAWYTDCPVGRNQISRWNKEATQKVATDLKRSTVTNFLSCPSTSKSVF